MGLGALLNRSFKYVVTDTATSQVQTFEIVTGAGVFPEWNTAAAYSGGMGLPGAWRAVTMLSDLLGSVPWHAYRDGPLGRPVRITPTPELLERPNPPETRINTLSSLVLDLVWHGNAFAVVAARDGRGMPTRYLPVEAELVYVKRVELADGAPFPVGTIAYQVNHRWLGEGDVLHVKGPHRPGAVRGMGVLENHLSTTLQLADDQNRQARESLAGVPTGVLKVSNPDATQAALTEAKTGWMAAQQTRTVAVLNSATDFEALAWNPSETQLLDARKFSDGQLANIFGVDPSWLGAAQTSRVYSNIEMEAINLWRYSALVGHLARIEQVLTAVMPVGQWAKANLDAALRADTLTRYRAHAVGIAAGFLHPDEARELESRAPLTDAQRATLPVVTAPSTAADERSTP